MGSVVRDRELRLRSPHHHEVPDYIVRMKEGRMPRPEALGVDSWVTSRGSRTFGFKSADEREVFRARYGV